MAIYAAKEEGDEDTEIMRSLGVDPEEYQEALACMYATKSDELRRKTTEEHYIAYCLEQRRNIKDLNGFIQELDEKKQYNAVVGAIRLRSDIVDKMVTRGQEFGLIAKQAEKRQVFGGLILADLSDKELRKQIAQEFSGMESLVKRFGDGKMSELPKADLYYGDAIDVESEEVPPPKKKSSAEGLREALARTKQKKAKRTHASP